MKKHVDINIAENDRFKNRCLSIFYNMKSEAVNCGLHLIA